MKPDKTALDRWLDASLEEFGFSPRARYYLNPQGTMTVEELILLPEGEVLESRSFGVTTLREVKKRLNERGLRLGMSLRDGEWTYGDEP